MSSFLKQFLEVEFNKVPCHWREYMEPSSDRGKFGKNIGWPIKKDIVTVTKSPTGDRCVCLQWRLCFHHLLESFVNASPSLRLTVTVNINRISQTN